MRNLFFHKLNINIRKKTLVFYLISCYQRKLYMRVLLGFLYIFSAILYFFFCKFQNFYSENFATQPGRKNKYCGNKSLTYFRANIRILPKAASINNFCTLFVPFWHYDRFRSICQQLFWRIVKESNLPNVSVLHLSRMLHNRSAYYPNNSQCSWLESWIVPGRTTWMCKKDVAPTRHIPFNLPLRRVCSLWAFALKNPRSFL